MKRMKNAHLLICLTLIMITLHPAKVNAWDWTKIFGGASSTSTQGNSGKTTSTIGNLLEGVFSRSDIQVKEMAGTWKIDGSAVSFKSEDFLSKAGGVAAAAALQTELDPYYEKYGLIGGSVILDTAGNCTLKLKRGSLKGVVTRQGKGEFLFKVSLFGQSINALSLPVYVRKTTQTMDLMFDAAKLKQLLQVAAKISGNTLAKTVVDMLDRYEGIYIGFGMQAESTPTTGSQSGTQTGLGTLRDILTGGR